MRFFNFFNRPMPGRIFQGSLTVGEVGVFFFYDLAMVSFLLIPSWVTFWLTSALAVMAVCVVQRFYKRILRKTKSWQGQREKKIVKEENGYVA